MLHLSLALLDSLGARWSYYTSFVVLGLAIPVVVYFAFTFLWPFLRGRPLSQWVMQQRKNPTAEETRRLRNVGQILGTLAHDVLKHRLLGLVSLVQSLDALEEEVDDSQPADDRKSVVETHPQQWDGLRSELLRVCGARAAPGDRLWARWTEAFAEVRRLSGGGILPPWADKSFRRTDKTLKRLRRMVRNFVAGERESAISPERIRKLGLPELESVHGVVLRIAESCRPQVDPQAIIDEAMSAVSALVGRKGARRRVRPGKVAGGQFVGNAAGRLIVTSLERLLDNALRLSGDAPVGLEVELEHDELLGDEVLVFRVLDTLEAIPTVDEFGTGLNNARQELSEFECGLSFQRIPPSAQSTRAPFVKEARITVPVTQSESLPRSRPARIPQQIAVWGTVFGLLLAGLATSRILGGAPVQFAGGGTTVVEFRVEVGDELNFTLCEGGQDPQVEVTLEQEGCRMPGCSLAGVVAELEACSQGISDSECPGVFRWTPQFYDGSREGSSYELTVACSAPGPPASQDKRRIRLVVSRPNSPPQFNMLQLSDGSSDMVIPLVTEREFEIPAGGDITIQAFARDDDDIDDRVLEFQLVPDHAPDNVMRSLDGRFVLGPLEWSDDGYWGATVSVSDNVAPPVEKRVQLRAGRLRPVSVTELNVRNEVSGEKLQCAGPNDALLCEVSDDQAYLTEVAVWFDPLLKRIDERLVISTSDESAVTVTQRPDRLGRTSQTPQVGQRWDVRARYSERLLAMIELVELPADTAPGQRSYTFRIDVQPLISSDPQNLTLKLNVYELSGRTEPLDMMLWLARSEFDKRPRIGVNRRYLELAEYDVETDHSEGTGTVRVILYEDNDERALAQPTITCEAGALEEFFDPPRVKSFGDGNWKVDVSLRPGCIEGLGGQASAYGSDAGGTCRLDIATADGTERTSVRVRINDKACAPEILTLEPLQSEEIAAGSVVEWRTEFMDPDGDLDVSGVRLKGASGFRFELSEDPNSPGTRLFGSLEGTVHCEDMRHPISVEVQDNKGFVTRQQLSFDMACPALVATADEKTLFEVDEGESLLVPLLAAENVQLDLTTGPGRLTDEGWEWTASCRNGRSHKVLIQGDSEEAYGEPLEMEVSISRCAVSLDLEENGRTIPTKDTFVMETFRSRRLRVVPQRARAGEVEIEVELKGNNRNLFARVLSAAPDMFDLQCRKAGEQGTLIISAVPTDEAAAKYLPAEPLEVSVRCVQQGTDDGPG